MKCRYSSLQVLHRIGLNPVLRIKIEIDFKEDFREDYPLLVLDPRFKVELYEDASSSNVVNKAPETS